MVCGEAWVGCWVSTIATEFLKELPWEVCDKYEIWE